MTADRDRSDTLPGISGQYSTAPTSTTNGYAGFKSSDEFGFSRKTSYNTISGPQIGSSQSTYPGQSTSNSQFPDPMKSGARPRSAGGIRPGSSGSGGVSRVANTKLTVANMGDDIPEESPISSVRSGQRNPASAQPPWISAEAEKRQLYESAKAQVDRVQGGVSSPQRDSPSPQVSVLYSVHRVFAHRA